MEVMDNGTHVMGVHPIVAKDEAEEKVKAMHKIEVSFKSGDLLEERHISSATTARNMDVMPINVHIKMVSMLTWQSQVDILMRNLQSY